MLLGVGAFLMYWAVKNPKTSAGVSLGPVSGALGVVKTGKA
jgi:hypothetical protein